MKKYDNVSQQSPTNVLDNKVTCTSQGHQRKRWDTHKMCKY